MKKRTVLVLGGDGFLGSHFVDATIAAGHSVTVFDRFPYSAPRNLSRHQGQIRLVSGEFANRDLLAAALEGQEVVYHFITATNPAASWSDPLVEVEQNLAPTVQFLELAAEAGVRKVVYPSSGGTVYGLQNGLVAETALPGPFSPYGVIKLCVEHFMRYARVRHGLAGDDKISVAHRRCTGRAGDCGGGHAFDSGWVQKRD